MSSQYGELWPTSGWDLLSSLGHPSKFQGVLRRGFVTAPTSLNGSQPNFARYLAISWTGALHICICIHFRGLLPHNRILPGAKFTLHPSLAFSYIGSVCVCVLHGIRVMGVSETVALNRGRHLYLAGRPSRWALAHILVVYVLQHKYLLQ